MNKKAVLKFTSPQYGVSTRIEGAYVVRDDADEVDNLREVVVSKILQSTLKRHKYR